MSGAPVVLTEETKTPCVHPKGEFCTECKQAKRFEILFSQPTERVNIGKFACFLTMRVKSTFTSPPTTTTKQKKTLSITLPGGCGSIAVSSIAPKELNITLLKPGVYFFYDVKTAEEIESKSFVEFKETISYFEAINLHVANEHESDCVFLLSFLFTRVESLVKQTASVARTWFPGRTKVTGSSIHNFKAEAIFTNSGTFTE
jgi:hypothetical protein